MVDVDVRASYPAGFVLLRCGQVLGAIELHEVDVTAELRALAQRLACGDHAPLYDSATYGDLGLTLALVRCRGELWPVELPGLDRNGEPRFYVTPLHSDVALPFSWPDVLAPALKGKVPDIVSAVRLAPVGIETPRRFALFDGKYVESVDDLVTAGVRLRAAHEHAGERRGADQLRVMLNALTSGVWGRIDQVHLPGQLAEVAAEWTWPPIATSVAAVSRLWLSMLEVAVPIVARDTDGAALLASPRGGTFDLSDGRMIRAPSWDEIDAVLAPFDTLGPFGDGRSFWRVVKGTVRRPLHIVALAAQALRAGAAPWREVEGGRRDRARPGRECGRPAGFGRA